jgi:heme/copper-type cytochrome/quinol oxidase subunit 4
MLFKLVPFISILFYTASLAWVNNLHKHDCTCAEEWRLRYMRVYFYIGLALSIATIAAIYNHNWLKFINKYITPVMFLFTFVYAVIALSYFVDLQKKQCGCSVGGQRNFMYIMSIVQVVGIFMMFALVTRNRLGISVK